MQVYHGTQYVDEVVAMRLAYVHQDANWNVTSLTDLKGVVLDRYYYSPCGQVAVVAETVARPLTHRTRIMFPERIIGLLWVVLGLPALLTVAGCPMALGAPGTSETSLRGANTHSQIDGSHVDELPDTVRLGEAIDWDAWLKPPPPDQPQPKFVCDATHVELGELWAAVRRSVKGWWFRNEGDAPLRIRVRHGCDTDPVGPRGFTIPPGESRQLEFMVRIARRSGARMSFRPVVLTNDRSNPRVKLEATCTVLNAVRLDPHRSRVEGFDRAKDQVTASITITRGDGGPIRPQLMAVERRVWTPGDDGRYYWDVTPLDRNLIEADIREVRAGEHYELKVIAHAPWPKFGSRLVYLVLTTAVPEMPRKTIQVSFRTEPRLVREPHRFSVPARPKLAIERRMTLKWSADKPNTRVLGVSVNVPGLTARVETLDTGDVLVLTVPAGVDLSETQRMAVTLRTDDPEFPELMVTISRKD